VSEAEPHLSRVLDDPASTPFDRRAALSGLARCASDRGNKEEALAHATRAVAEAELLGPDALSATLETLTTAQRATARLEDAEVSARRHLAVARELESPVRLYFALRSVVDLALDRGQIDEARARLAEMASHAAILDRARGSAEFSGEVERRRQRLAALEDSSA
jgi:hypothetical protein